MSDATLQTPAAGGRVDDVSSLLAERVRAACVDAALLAYEEAGIRGLCVEGRWEAAVAAIRQFDLSEVLERYAGPLPSGEPMSDRGPVNSAPLRPS